jgi:hypothetical protein
MRRIILNHTGGDLNSNVQEVEEFHLKGEFHINYLDAIQYSVAIFSEPKTFDGEKLEKEEHNILKSSTDETIAKIKDTLSIEKIGDVFEDFKQLVNSADFD